MALSRIALYGEIDFADCTQLRSQLAIAIAATPADLLVDCAHLTFIGSHGVDALLEANAHLEATGRRLLVANLSGSPRRVFDVLGLAHFVHADRDLVVVPELRTAV
jgi:anti-anti-sigma factor